MLHGEMVAIGVVTQLILEDDQDEFNKLFQRNLNRFRNQVIEEIRNSDIDAERKLRGSDWRVRGGHRRELGRHAFCRFGGTAGV